MASTPRDNLGREDNATHGNSATTSHSLEDNLANIGSASPGAHDNKRRKRRRASSGVSQGSLPNTRGPKVAQVVRRAKGKQAQKAGSLGANPSPTEEKPGKPSQGGDQGIELRMFAGLSAQHFSDDIRCSWQRR